MKVHTGLGFPARCSVTAETRLSQGKKTGLGVTPSSGETGPEI